MENMFMNLDRYFDSNVSERKDEGWKGVLVYDGQTDEQTLLIVELLSRLKSTYTENYSLVVAVGRIQVLTVPSMEKFINTGTLSYGWLT